MRKSERAHPCQIPRRGPPRVAMPHLDKGNDVMSIVRELLLFLGEIRIQRSGGAVRPP
jgi:hypothetical protein